MEKKVLKSEDRKLKPLTLSRETFRQLTPSDLINVAGGELTCQRSASADCCKYH